MSKLNSPSVSNACTPNPTAENTEQHLNVITPAKIEWQVDDTGNSVPVSGEFGDVYFSHADGLAESRHVFLAHNQLPERLANLAPKHCFTIAELGFGTGLNLLAVWQLWRQLRDAHPQLATARLHVITTEKHPISREDLNQILLLWGQRAPELAELIEQLLAVYPPLIAGCHRLNFFADNLTVDMWLGDATDSLAKLPTGTSSHSRPYIDAWFLDGFAPSCNQSLWAETVFAQIQRLSQVGTTAATYSCAGTVKRALQDAGFQIEKVKGFGRKREMLTAIMTDSSHTDTSQNSYSETPTENYPNAENSEHSLNTVIIGAGVSGLLTAWALANRGINVTLVDKSAPLAGASGNPRALLAPKMTPIHHVDEHLHTIGYLYSSRLYRKFNDKAAQQQTAPVLEATGALDLLIKANIGPEQIADYPDEMASTLSNHQAQDITGLREQDLSDNLYLPQSGLVNPQALKEVIMSHPLITFQPLKVTQIRERETYVSIVGHNISSGHEVSSNQKVSEHSSEDKITTTIHADNVVICAAYESHELDARLFDCRKIRGQLSWFTLSAAQWAKLPELPLKYGGYCASFVGQKGDSELNNVAEGRGQLLLGASFVRNDIDTDIRGHEHQNNRDKLVKAIPELEAIMPTDINAWQGRAGIRTQTPDYHPMVGQLAKSRRLWTLSAMGAKGYALAPICAEALADMMLGDFTPLSNAMLERLSPNRLRLQTPLA